MDFLKNYIINNSNCTCTSSHEDSAKNMVIFKYFKISFYISGTLIQPGVQIKQWIFRH